MTYLSVQMFEVKVSDLSVRWECAVRKYMGVVPRKRLQHKFANILDGLCGYGDHIVVELVLQHG